MLGWMDGSRGDGQSF
ncbi:unnamed protein product, partial [Adineta steineri]